VGPRQWPFTVSRAEFVTMPRLVGETGWAAW
jgi:hypothetical protein